MRSWPEDDEGLIVEMSPKRAGGNRPELAESQQIELRSGLGLGVACGNAGDHVVSINDTPFERGPSSPRMPQPFFLSDRAVYPLEREG